MIELEGNPTTGYEWELEFDKGTIKSVDRKYQSAAEGFGGGGKEQFTLKAIKKGDAVIRAIYKRPWEAQPIEEKTFKVRINK